MNLKKVLIKCGSSHIFFYSLVWLLVLLVHGTIDQRYIGLHAAQEKYFSAWITNFGPIPTLGGRAIMTIMTLNLACLLLDFSTWSWRKSGILIAHFGSLLLLLGGFITALTSIEGSMSLKEGSTSAEFIDYHELELLFTDRSPKDHDNITSFYGQEFKPGQKLIIGGVHSEIEVKSFFTNSALVPKNNPTMGMGMASRFELQEKEPEKEANRNIRGMTIEHHNQGQPSKTYIIQEDMSIRPTVVIDDKVFEINLQRRHHRLPFQIKLIDFVRELHPGTETPRSYHSDILLADNNVQREVRIQMNEPLRYRDYTFFQSSFIQGRNGESSIFSVVKNSGRNFPYISSIVICIGLLIHMIIRLPSRLRRTASVAEGGI